MEFQNKTYVITGGANGIGRCIATELYKLGSKIILLDNDISKQEDLKKKFKEENKFLFIPCDLAQSAEMAQAVQKIQESNETIDGIIHNAAIAKGGLWSANYEDFLETQKVNVAAPFFLTKLLLPILSKKTSIILISSTRANMSQEDTESYSASKGAINALCHAMSITLSGKARVNAISPGWIDTKYCRKEDESTHLSLEDHIQHPSKRVGTPFDIAKAVKFLLDDENDFINGENITIDGGMSKMMIYHNDYGWRYEQK